MFERNFPVNPNLYPLFFLEYLTHPPLHNPPNLLIFFEGAYRSFENFPTFPFGHGPPISSTPFLLFPVSPLFVCPVFSLFSSYGPFLRKAPSPYLGFPDIDARCPSPKRTISPISVGREGISPPLPPKPSSPLNNNLCVPHGWLPLSVFLVDASYLLSFLSSIPQPLFRFYRLFFCNFFPA